MVHRSPMSAHQVGYAYFGVFALSMILFAVLKSLRLGPHA